MSDISVRNRFFSLILASLLVTGALGTTTRSYADTSTWIDLFRPLITNVLVPGASAEMQKLINHGSKNKNATATPGATAVVTMPGATVPPVVGAVPGSVPDGVGATPVEVVAPIVIPGDAGAAPGAVGASTAGVGATLSTMASIVANTPQPTPEAPITAQYTAAAPPPPPVATP